MPVFLTVRNSGPVVPAFQERGIAELMPGQIGDVPINVSSDFSSIVQKITFSSIHSAICSQKLQSPVIGDLEAYNIFKDFHPPFYFERPSGSFIFSSLTDADMETVRAAGLHEEPGRPGIYIGSPGSEAIPTLFGLGPVDGRVNPGTVTSDGYLAYIIGLKAMAMFSFVSQQVVGQPNLSLLYNSHVSYEKKTDDEPLPDYKTWDVVELKSVTPESRARIAASDRTVLSVVNNPVAVYTPFSRDTSFSPRLITLDPTTIPNGMKGHFFAYFPGMNVPDKDIMSEIFGSLFDRSLGATATSSYNLLQRIRKGFRNLALFRGGQAMSHAFVGIRLARESCCPLHYVISNGVYYGFVLAGNLKVRLYRSETPEMDTAELRRDIGTLNKHVRCLREILRILNQPENSDGARIYNYEMDDVKTSRGLARVLHSINPDLYVSTDWKKDLKDQMEGLMYGDVFAPVNMESFQAFTTFLVTGNMDSIGQYPAYLTGLMVEQPGPLVYGLSMFGPRVPTLNIAGKGRDFVIPTANAVDANLVVPEGGKRPLQYLPITEAPFGQAVGLWTSFLNSGKFTIANPRGKKAEFTDVRIVKLQIGSEPAFQTVYDQLKAVVNSRRGNVPGGKRKRGGEQETGNKRAKKAAVEDGMEL